MAKSIFQRLIVCALAAWMAVPLSADIKIKTKRETMGHASEDTVYIKGARERTEMGTMMGMNVNIISILQCDKNRYIQLNPANKTYIISPLETEAGSAAAGTPPAQTSESQPAKGKSKGRNKDQGESRRGGVVTMNLSSSDTGERKKMFGYTARHVTSTMSMDASPDACAKGDFKLENDGWYADLSPTLVCRTHVHNMTMGGGGERAGCQDTYRFHNSGFANAGYPLKLVTTYNTGKNSFTTSVEVTELSKATLDPDLFEIPEGYTEARNYSDLMGISAGQILGHMQQSGEGKSAPIAPTKIPRKNPGITRVGVPLIKNDSSQKLDQMRDYLILQLKNAQLDPVPVDGNTPAELIADAKSKDCDYILYVDIASIKGSSAGAKIGGFFGVGSGKPSTYDVMLAYKLNKPNNSPPLLDSTEESRENTKPMPGVYTALEQVVRATLKYIRENE